MNDAPSGGGVGDIPRRAVTRGVKLAALPLGMAGRATLGLGKRIGGRPAEIVTAEIQQRTADQVFKVLGELKGGAMKFGQTLSVFEAALPEPLVAPYRATLTKLQEAAPPLPPRVVQQVMTEHLGPKWRELFREFDERAVAAASVGQVHKATWSDGRARGRQDPVPRRRARPCSATSTRSPGSGGCSAGSSPASTSSRCSPSSRRASQRSSTTPSRRRRSRVSRRRSRATPTSASRPSCTRAATSS